MQNMKEYFASAVGLKYIDFSNTVLGAEMLKVSFVLLFLFTYLLFFFAAIIDIYHLGCDE